MIAFHSVTQINTTSIYPTNIKGNEDKPIVNPNGKEKLQSQTVIPSSEMERHSNQSPSIQRYKWFMTIWFKKLLLANTIQPLIIPIGKKESKL